MCWRTKLQNRFGTLNDHLQSPVTDVTERRQQKGQVPDTQAHSETWRDTRYRFTPPTLLSELAPFCKCLTGFMRPRFSVSTVCQPPLNDADVTACAPGWC